MLLLQSTLGEPSRVCFLGEEKPRAADAVLQLAVQYTSQFLNENQTDVQKQPLQNK